MKMIPNPFELLDRGGLALSSRLVRSGYRNLGANPIAVQYIPWLTFVTSSAFIFFVDPIENAFKLVVLACIVGLYVPALLRDIPEMKRDWDLSQFRRYQAMALQNRDRLFLRSFVTVIVLWDLTQALGFGPIPVHPVSTVDALQTICFPFLFWFEACDLPEPDDGDLVAQPG